MIIGKPGPDEYAPFYQIYIEQSGSDDLLKSLKENEQAFFTFLSAIPKEKQDYRYADGKWSVKEVILHVIDAERIFAYRALRFARNDKTDLPGFDETLYAPESNAGLRSLESLIDEYAKVREATIALFDSLTEQTAMRKGKANGFEFSARGLGFAIVGHLAHHMQVLKERYIA